jgi:hypothetical protein
MMAVLDPIIAVNIIHVIDIKSPQIERFVVIRGQFIHQ